MEPPLVTIVLIVTVVFPDPGVTEKRPFFFGVRGNDEVPLLAINHLDDGKKGAGWLAADRVDECN